MLGKVRTLLNGVSSFDNAKSALRKKNTVKIDVDPESFEAINPIHSIENGFILSKDGMVYRGYRLSEPAYERSDERAYHDMAEALDMSYRELPIGSCVHRHSPFYNVYYNETSKNFEIDYSMFFDFKKKEHLLENPIMANHSLIFIGMTANKESSKSSANPLNTFLAQVGSAVFSNPFENIELVMQTIDDVISRFFSRLGVLGVKHKQMDTDELKAIVNQYLNLDHTKAGASDLKVNYMSKFPYLCAGNKLVGVASFSGELQEVKSSSKNEYGVESSFNYSMFYDLKFPHIVNQYIYVRDQTQVLQEIEERKVLIEGTSDEVIAQSMGNHINDVRGNNQKLLEFGTNIICYSSREAELNHFLESAGSAIRQMGKGSAQVEVIEDVFNLFVSSIPGAIHTNYRRYPYPAIYCGCLTTFPGQYYDNGNYLVKGRHGRPVLIRSEPDDPKSSNNNVIIGPTGGGKSVFAFNMMAHYLERGDEVKIVDKGASHKMLAKLFDMDYYDFNDLEKVDLNFFRTQTDDSGKHILNEEKKDGVISVQRLLWKGDAQISKTQITILESLLDMFYEKVNQTGDELIMDTYLRFLKDVSYTDITDRLDVGPIHLEKYFDKEELLLALSRYSSKSSGYNGKIFNQKQAKYFKRGGSAVYELSNIAQIPDLYSLFTVSLSNIILQDMYNRRHIRKHLVYDESSEALPGDQGKLLKMLYREIRKENGDVGIIVQLITDITNNPNGKVMLDNAINRYLLDHRMATGSLPDVQTALGLSQHAMELLKSLNKIPSPKYREFFMQRLDQCNVYALELPEEIRLASSTSADDQRVLNDYIKRVHDPKLALKSYIEDLKTKGKAA